MKKKELNKIIKAFRGIQRLGLECGVSPRTIEGYRSGNPIPEPTQKLLRLLYEQKKEDIKCLKSCKNL